MSSIPSKCRECVAYLAEALEYTCTELWGLFASQISQNQPQTLRGLIDKVVPRIVRQPRMLPRVLDTVAQALHTCIAQ